MQNKITIEMDERGLERVSERISERISENIRNSVSCVLVSDPTRWNQSLESLQINIIS